MKFTENFNLNLPDLDDMADVEKMNENFQTIDTKMKSLETDPELAANVVDIKNKIGTESDADTQPTLFGRLAQLKKVLLEKLAEVLTKVTGIDGKIGIFPTIQKRGLCISVSIQSRDLHTIRRMWLPTTTIHIQNRMRTVFIPMFTGWV